MPGQPNSGGTDPGDLFPGRPLRRAVPGGERPAGLAVHHCPERVPGPGAAEAEHRDPAAPGAAGHGGLEDREEALRLHCLLHGLGEPYKEVFHLRVFGELPFGDIARVFGRTESWARVTFYRAKQKIIAGLEEEKHGG